MIKPERTKKVNSFSISQAINRVIQSDTYYICLLLQDRLVANEFIQCRKVCEHVLEKVLGAETTPSGGNASNSSQNSQSDANSEGSQVPAEDRIELWCNDVVSKIWVFSFFHK